ncbi:hypothetical protein GCM10011390_51140 [Aureimonas endophytica]|uniref:Uncharacterized protein n=1 Tax=Aureimonas endophytica TaxID=2027858 RepID=A0A917A638_9HYPH|nr:hypothetical protein GCM10011390_51140 [Aureimonas endophytica]
MIDPGLPGGRHLSEGPQRLQNGRAVLRLYRGDDMDVKVQTGSRLDADSENHLRHIAERLPELAIQTAFEPVRRPAIRLSVCPTLEILREKNIECPHLASGDSGQRVMPAGGVVLIEPMTAGRSATMNDPPPLHGRDGA